VRLDRDEEAPPEVPMTPLIDIMFLLLVFFLAVTTFTQEEREMDLNLPTAKTAAKGDDAHVMVINVLRDGSVTVDGSRVTDAALDQKLRAAAARRKDQEVLIRGDVQANFGTVAKALDAVRGAALNRVSIAALGAVEASGR
jgi:biopolymer transport protein ExbD